MPDRIPDAETLAVRTVVPMGPRAWWIALTPDGRHLWATVGRAREVVVIAAMPFARRRSMLRSLQCAEERPRRATWPTARLMHTLQSAARQCSFAAADHRPRLYHRQKLVKQARIGVREPS